MTATRATSRPAWSLTRGTGAGQPLTVALVGQLEHYQMGGTVMQAFRRVLVDIDAMATVPTKHPWGNPMSPATWPVDQGHGEGKSIRLGLVQEAEQMRMSRSAGADYRDSEGYGAGAHRRTLPRPHPGGAIRHSRILLSAVDHLRGRPFEPQVCGKLAD